MGIWGRAVWIHCSIRRFRCRPCGKTVTEAVPWARHDSNFTRPFEDAVGLMAQRTDQTAVSQLFGISWVTVGKIAERLVDELLNPDRFAELRRIGVDEISFRKRHRYLTVVTDHDTGKVIWVGEGKCSETLRGFFESLEPAVCNAIKIVSMDMSKAFIKAVRESLPNAQIAFDPFHVIKLANEALHEVRRELAREARRRNDQDAAEAIKGKRWALSYSMDAAPDRHWKALAELRPDTPLGVAYLMKEGLIDIFRGPRGRAVSRLLSWIRWTRDSELKPFTRLSQTLTEHFRGIKAVLENRVTNARAEGINNKVRLLSHRAFGFHSAAPLIATIYLCCGGINLPQTSHLL